MIFHINRMLDTTKIIMDKQPITVSFYSQKGGIGKTTLTVLTASLIHYVKGYSTVVIDCDYPQHSIAEMRGREAALATEDPFYKRMAYEIFKSLGRQAYTIVESSAADALAAAERVRGEESPDIIFFDLPGTLNTAGVVKTIAMTDYLFIPVSADRVVLESTMQFAAAINDSIITTGKGNIKAMHLLWTMVDGRERTELYEAYERVICELGLNVMNTRIPDTKRFRKEIGASHRPVFRSTLFPADKALERGSNIGMLADEICRIINISSHVVKE
jgi:cellulose biosynthesis protein BcsQ